MELFVKYWKRMQKLRNENNIIYTERQEHSLEALLWLSNLVFLDLVTSITGNIVNGKKMYLHDIVCMWPYMAVEDVNTYTYMQ